MQSIYLTRLLMSYGILANMIQSSVNNDKRVALRGGGSAKKPLGERKPECRIIAIGTHKGRHNRSLDRRLKGLREGDRVVLEYGGDYCKYNWAAIASNPDGYHESELSFGQFRETYTHAIAKIKSLGAQPVLLTLPTLLPQRFFDHISRNLNRDNLLQWLGGDVCSLNRWQEQFNEEILSLAAQHQLAVIDINNAFLQHNYMENCYRSDGMHPNSIGDAVIEELVANWNSRQN